MNYGSVMPMEVPTGGITRLQHFVTERRHALNISRAEVQARGGPSPSTMNKALAGSRRLSRPTLGRLDRALGWAPGSAAAVLQGGTPTARIPAPGDVGSCPAHEHLVTVLETVRSQLRSSQELIDGLLGTGHAS